MVYWSGERRRMRRGQVVHAGRDDRAEAGERRGSLSVSLSFPIFARQRDTESVVVSKTGHLVFFLSVFLQLHHDRVFSTTRYSICLDLHCTLCLARI
jgi:hypothetical protein